MYCKRCGKKLDDDSRFCPNCGINIQREEEQACTSMPANIGYETVENKPARAWSVFALIGKVLGIVCFATSFIPWIHWLVLEVAVIGIIFSCLGKVAKTVEAESNSRVGLSFSIAALATSVFTIILYLAILVSV